VSTDPTDPTGWIADAGDHHTWVRPAPGACPDCECCTARLCATGRESWRGCAAYSTEADRATVADCPCSAATTPGTAAHRVEQALIGKRAEAATPASSNTPGRPVCERCRDEFCAACEGCSCPPNLCTRYPLLED
jgi:hypothetical protein